MGERGPVFLRVTQKFGHNKEIRDRFENNHTSSLKRIGHSEKTGVTIETVGSQFRKLGHSEPQGFGSGSGRIRCFLHGSGSGFQISLDPDPGPVSAQILEQKKLQKGL